MAGRNENATGAHNLHDDAEGAAPRRTLRNASQVWLSAIRSDFEAMRAGRAKYLGDNVAQGAFAPEVVKRIGLQMMVAIRTMHWFRDAGLTTGAQVVSRMIRLVYGAEIHWEAQFAPGVGISHGNGLVIGSKARIGTGCVLLHNTTLGNAFDAASGTIGGPILEDNVHVGPGCAILGPITVGKGSKLMAGTILDRSVPSGSLVKPPAPVVSSRGQSEG
ncbi:MAG TPA: hypothetical protein VKP30_17795 [Polyangiaceae bacterium]|nr:hypothetical protein [Polyangiaceae bacterium]